MEKSRVLMGIQQKVRDGEYEYSKHAVDQSIVRGISVSEAKEALLSQVEMIEDYPHDFYGPSCLVLGFTGKNRPIHCVCSYPSRPIVKIVTVYEPTEAEWVNHRKRNQGSL